MEEILKTIASDIFCQDEWGQTAQYIPELAGIDPRQFAISVCLQDGSLYSAGAADKPFSIQSVAKVFSLVAALGRVGDQLWTRVAREPSGNSFDSVLLLEQENGRPRNPYVNAGAIVTTDALLAGRAPKLALAEILSLIKHMSDSDSVYINEAVAASEKKNRIAQQGACLLSSVARKPV